MTAYLSQAYDAVNFETNTKWLHSFADKVDGETGAKGFLLRLSGELVAVAELVTQVTLVVFKQVVAVAKFAIDLVMHVLSNFSPWHDHENYDLFTAGWFNHCNQKDVYKHVGMAFGSLAFIILNLGAMFSAHTHQLARKVETICCGKRPPVVPQPEPQNADVQLNPAEEGPNPAEQGAGDGE